MKQRGTLDRKESGVTYANGSREFCIFLTSSCNESMWETSQRTSLCFGTAVQLHNSLHNSLHTRTVHPMHRVNTFQFYIAKSAKPAFPPHPPVPLGSLGSGLFIQSCKQWKNWERVYRNSRGVCMWGHTQHTNIQHLLLQILSGHWRWQIPISIKKAEEKSSISK